MADWLEKIPWASEEYQQASFRGAKFWVETAESEVGRKTVTHLYPGRNDIEVEDLGRAPRRFKLEAFIIGGKSGTSYRRDLDLLLEQIEKKGTGKLVHPFWGELTATIEGTVKIRESIKPAGIARISMTVVEKGDLVIKAAPDTAAAMAVAADVVEAALASEFTELFDLDALFEALRNSVLGKILAAVAFIQKVKGKIDAAMDMIDEVAAAIDSLADAIVSIINLPATIASRFQGVIASISASIGKISSKFTDDTLPNGGFSNKLLDADTGEPLDLSTATTEEIAAATVMRDQSNTNDARKLELVMTAFRDVIAYGDDIVDAPSTTPTREAERAAQEAFVRLLHVSWTAETCRVTAQFTPPSVDKAMEIRDELTDQIDVLSEDDNCSDDVFVALQDLRASVIDHAESISAALPVVIEYVPSATIPAFVIAYDLYGDAGRADEIVERNDRLVYHPAFVMGGQALEVLSDE